MNEWANITAAAQNLTRFFNGSFINEDYEFIASRKTNACFNVRGLQNDMEAACKVLEWLSRDACKAEPYTQNWRNERYQNNMRLSINRYLDTAFSRKDMELIYQKLGNSVNHVLTEKFVSSAFDMDVLRAKCKEENDGVCES